MAETIQVDIVTPEKVIYSEAADMVTAPGTLGEFGVLPGHAAFVTTLEVGEAVVKKGNTEYRMALSGGFAEVADDKCIILADTAEEAQDIDVARAEAAKEKATDRLRTLGPDDSQYQEAAAALRRAENRIRVAAKR